MIIYSGHINLRTQKASGGERKGYLQLYTGRRTKSGSPSQHYVNILRLLWLVQRATWQTSSLQRQLDKTRIHETTYSLLVPLFSAHSTTASKQIIVINNTNNLTAFLQGKTVGPTKNHNNNYCKQRQTVKALDTAKLGGVFTKCSQCCVGRWPGPSAVGRYFWNGVTTAEKSGSRSYLANRLLCPLSCCGRGTPCHSTGACMQQCTRPAYRFCRSHTVQHGRHSAPTASTCCSHCGLFSWTIIEIK